MPHFEPLPDWTFVLGVMTSLFSVINPASAAMVFAGVTAGMEGRALDRAARKASFTATATMLLFALVGQFIFSFFHFTALAMRFVGGILVMYRALNLLYGEDPRERTTERERQEAALKLPDDFAIIPFGIPMLAGPGTLSTIMGTIVGLSIAEYLAVLAAIVVNGWLCWLILRQAPRVTARMGAIGTKVMNKLMGLILAGVAMQFLINGVKGLVVEIRAMPPAAAAAPSAPSIPAPAAPSAQPARPSAPAIPAPAAPSAQPARPSTPSVAAPSARPVRPSAPAAGGSEAHPQGR